MTSKMQRMLESIAPSIAALLTRGSCDAVADDPLARAVFSTPRKWDDLDAVEAAVRERMAHNIDDLTVSFQVAYSRSVGYPTELWIEHICLAGSMEVCIRHHGYMMRCAGPITLEVHEREQRTIAEWPARSAEFSRAIGESSKSALAHVAAKRFAESINRPPLNT